MGNRLGQGLEAVRDQGRGFRRGKAREAKRRFYGALEGPWRGIRGKGEGQGEARDRAGGRGKGAEGGKINVTMRPWKYPGFSQSRLSLIARRERRR